jgi:cellulose synthase/poly-beta-1,6-N-acetylglucosamine synthase-like glycosyltransferase
MRGFLESRYDAVSFVDDDNWMAPNWVRLVAEILATRPEVGALGGLSEPVCERPPPPWFEHFPTLYAVGAQGERAGDVTESRGQLWGAGLTIRRSAWAGLERAGFRPSLLGRRGRALSAGEDSELCLALRLAGWRLWYDPRLRLCHYLPASRLDWRYLRRLHRGSGAATVALDPYHAALRTNDRGWALRRTWQWQAVSAFKHLLRPRGLFSLMRQIEGDPEMLAIERSVGRLLALLKARKRYAARYCAIKRMARSAHCASDVGAPA